MESPILSFLPLILMTIPFVLMCRGLAKQKGKHLSFWTLIGCIPWVNFFAFMFLIGAKDETLHQKIDELLAKQEFKNVK